MKKILIIRFSSFGDVLQSLSVAGALHKEWSDSEIHWITRSEFSPLIESHPAVSKVWGLNKRDGFKGLIRLAIALRHEKYTHIYDAHNNLRSRVLSLILRFPFYFLSAWIGGQRFLRRPLYRFRRFLLFKFRINKYPKPFNGQQDLLRPLRAWGISTEAPPTPQLYLPDLAERVQKHFKFDNFIALSPSVAFPLKRWPLPHWQSLIKALPDQNFVVLGGPEDTFLEQLVTTAPDRVLNLAGKLSLLESAYVISQSKLLIANDTGLMHVAEQVGHSCIALMGPAPFGFPSRAKTQILELDLYCRPCSKHGQGPCINPEFQKCLAGIAPEVVADHVRRIVPALVTHT